MASSKFELLRGACEAVENSEKVLAIAFQNRKKFLRKNETQPTAPAKPEDENVDGTGAGEDKPIATAKVSDAIVSQSKAVWWDMLIKDLTQTMHQKSKEVVSIYEDVDESFQTESAICTGNIAYKPAHMMRDEGEEEIEVSVWDNFYRKLDEIDVSNYNQQ